MDKIPRTRYTHHSQRCRSVGGESTHKTDLTKRTSPWRKNMVQTESYFPITEVVNSTCTLIQHFFLQGSKLITSADAPLKTLYDLNKNAPEMIGRPDFSIFVDGGIRRGTDILKALCLGANAVGLGRPVIYAGTGWGSDGVEKAILRECHMFFVIGYKVDR